MDGCIPPAFRLSLVLIVALNRTRPLRIYVCCYVAGVPGDRVEEDAEVLRQRLVRALVVPAEEERVHISDVRPKADVTAARRKPASGGALDLLDVTQLNLAQRVLVQLHGVGLIKNLGQVRTVVGALSCCQNAFNTHLKAERGCVHRGFGHP